MPSVPEDIPSPARADLPVPEILFTFLTTTVLATVVSVNFIPIGDQANRNLQRAGIDRVTQALDSYKSTMGVYPTKEEGLEVLWDQAAVVDVDLTDWSGPYLSGPVKDRWGSPIVYQWPSQLAPSDNDAKFDLHSLGPDGRINTSDDITNHDDLTLAGMDRAIESIFSDSDEDSDAS